MKHIFMLFLVSVLLMSGSPLHAQDNADCDTIVQTAIEQANDLCADLEPGEACLGSGQATIESAGETVSATPGDSITDPNMTI